MTLTLMWEARALPGRGAELLDWARAQRLPAAPLRRETFTAAQDRVLVLTWWDAPEEAAVPELPEPPAGLLARPVHRWRFVSRGVTSGPAEGSGPRGPLPGTGRGDRPAGV
ncbi:hypothetical protein LUX12_09305 [Streptomyces somaliensis]|uniref:hypothetical protein n=1 Tax=Streptomyces somaliensis TaxID=78355 RepID=UPI0020CBB2AF|nr:hypothetical protein [Streptomyces somaliensis]MCP9944926.1 hypothetical protein [Streptomyces somaliensis]MCP9961851.1 hypothetical protein [Streptomyces somaliensis]